MLKPNMRRVGREEKEGELWWGNLSDRRLVPVQCHLPACHLRLTGTVRGKAPKFSIFCEIEANKFNPVPNISIK